MGKFDIICFNVSKLPVNENITTGQKDKSREKEKGCQTKRNVNLNIAGVFNVACQKFNFFRFTFCPTHHKSALKLSTLLYSIPTLLSYQNICFFFILLPNFENHKNMCIKIFLDAKSTNSKSKDLFFCSYEAYKMYSNNLKQLLWNRKKLKQLQQFF